MQWVRHAETFMCVGVVVPTHKKRSPLTTLNPIGKSHMKETADIPLVVGTAAKKTKRRLTRDRWWVRLLIILSALKMF